MNTSLFRSWFALLALVTVAVFAAWAAAADVRPGRGHGGEPTYVLWTGWIALVSYVAIVAYVARKYVHRVKRPPTARDLAPAQKKLESAGYLFKQVEREILSGVLHGRADIEQRVQHILRKTGARRLVRVRVLPGAPGGPPFVLESHPTEPAGRVIVWLHAHLYLGIAAAALILLHGGGVYVTPMGSLLNALSLIVTLTGIVGVYYWAVGPGRLTRTEKRLTIEQAFALDEHFSRKIDEVLKKPRGEAGKADADFERNKPIWDELIKLQPWFKKWHGVPSADEAREALRAVEAQNPDLTSQQRDLLVLFCQREQVRGELQRLARVRSLMNSWRVVHVPASIVLVGLLIVHVLTIWWY